MSGEAGVGLRIRVTNPMFDRKDRASVCGGSVGARAVSALDRVGHGSWASVALAVWLLMQFTAGAAAQQSLQKRKPNPRRNGGPVSARATSGGRPPRVLEAQRFLLQRGWTPGHRMALRMSAVGPTVARSGGPTSLASQTLTGNSNASSTTWRLSALAPSYSEFWTRFGARGRAGARSL